jgi:RHS repeat-associated protein
MAPAQDTDPNGNRTAARFDELGRVIATAVMGKIGSAEGDTLDKPTTTFGYEFFDKNTGRPNVAHARARETHSKDDTCWQESYIYSDGAGHEVMKKVQAEPGLAPRRDASGKLVYKPDGQLDLTDTNPRWVGTGRTVLNNKGNPVKQYEPFFSSTHAYEEEDDLVQWGVTPVLHYDPLGRLIRTDLPNGTCSRVSFTPWRQESWDANDTVLDPGNAWYAARQSSASPAMSASEQRAATLAAAHAGTHSVTVFDTLGRAVVAVADLGGGKTLETRTVLDIEGNALNVRDPRTLDAMEHAFDLLGRKCWQKSIDAGERWTITNVVGTPLRTWDSRGHVLRTTYDALHRPTGLWVQTNGGPEALAERTVYGEEQPSPELFNLRGKIYQQYDGAGLVTHGAYDFKGNLLAVTRQLAKNYKGAIGSEAAADPPGVGEPLDWSGSPELEGETFTTTTTYDALNRATSRITPDRSLTRPAYNEAGLLERVDVWLRDAWDKNLPLEALQNPSMSPVVDIDYNAKGQREKIVYGNGVITAYTYDPLTFRLLRLTTTRDNGTGMQVQDLQYTFDPVGNIVEINDGAQETVYYNNDVIEPVALYEYDATYRLTSARGREHAGQNADIQQDENGFPLVTAPHPNDPQALRNYTELFSYDDAGNIQEMKHFVPVGTGGWTRRYEIDPTSNRLLSTSLPGDGPGPSYSARYGHDAHGNMTSMPHLAEVGWDFKDQMVSADKGGGGVVYFVYDAAGQRVRKVWEHNAIVEERIYLGGWEVYRKRQGGAVVLERETLHAMDGEKRIGLVETKTIDKGAPPFTPTPRVRYQLGNHLGSAVLEVDEVGHVISYEEYHPYGTTAYHSADSAVEVSARRYRYTGKEKDEETALYYHGARYYACWLGRWTAADPAGMVDGTNLYSYVKGNPVRLSDPSGRDSEVDKQIAQMDDVQLHRQLAGLSEEQRASFAGGATGKFAERAWGTINRGKMNVGYSFPGDTIVATAPRDVPAHKGSLNFPEERSPCPTCHGAYGAPLPKASVGDDPVITAMATGLRIVGAMLGDDSGTGPGADARRTAVAAFDENPNSTSAEAKSLPTRVSPTGEVVLNVVAVKGPAVLAKSVGRGLDAEAALGRGVGTDAARGGVSGARTLSATEWGAAESAYDVIRATDDVATIAANTGIRGSWVARAKDHLFFRTHQLDAGVARFDADPFIANAWGRMQAGTHTANDLALLRHELFEARFEGIFRTNYRTAHDAALRAGRTWEWKP